MLFFAFSLKIHQSIQVTCCRLNFSGIHKMAAVMLIRDLLMTSFVTSGFGDKYWMICKFKWAIKCLHILSNYHFFNFKVQENNATFSDLAYLDIWSCHKNW